MSHKVALVVPPRGKMIESLEADPLCQEFLAGLKRVSEVDLLCLSGNSYSKTFFLELEPYLAKMARVTSVILADIFTTRKDEHILPALEALSRCLQHKKVVLFDLSSNAICPDGCVAIRDVLRTNPTLKFLILNHVALSEAGTATISQAIEEGHLSLVVLRVIKNRIEKMAPRFAKMLERMTDLEELIIYQNSIKQEFMTALLQALLQNKHLKVLDIGDNHISDEHAQLVAQIIRGHERLRVLKIDDCNISSKGSKLIFQALAETGFKNLEEFSYNYNEFPSVSELVDIFKGYPHLKKLSCHGADDNDLEGQPATFTVDFETDDDEEVASDDDAKVPYVDEITQEMKVYFQEEEWKKFLPAEKAQVQQLLEEIKDFKFN